VSPADPAARHNEQFTKPIVRGLSLTARRIVSYRMVMWKRRGRRVAHLLTNFMTSVDHVMMTSLSVAANGKHEQNSNAPAIVRMTAHAMVVN